MAVIIGKQGKNIAVEDALDYVFGYSVSQDITDREWIKIKPEVRHVIMSKSMDTFCPIGPAIVHKSLIADPHNLNISCSLNGVVKQDSNTRYLIANIGQIINYLSK